MINFATPSDENSVYWYNVQVERVVDGDTFVGSIDFGFNLVRTGQYFRLAFVDTPERGKEGFAEATEFLRSAIEGKTIQVYSHNYSTGRYKRIIAELFVDGRNINRELLDKGLAVIPAYLL